MAPDYVTALIVISQTYHYSFNVQPSATVVLESLLDAVPGRENRQKQ